MDAEGSPALVLRPIGRVRSPFTERSQAPRQPAAALGAEGTIELFAASGIEHALEDLESFRFIWVLFWFHHNEGFRPKVLPPRSDRRRGVFATRSPYRPNPIGLSVVELCSVEGRTLRVRNVDMLDETPVLDIKPYVPYTDSIPTASSGWLEAAERPPDPIASFRVEFGPRALEALEFLEARYAILLREPVVAVLRLGPTPHPYRRIKRLGDAWVLAHKEWRIHFDAKGQEILVTRVTSGYRPSVLFGSSADDPALAAHRDFVARFGP
jgi:tRNA-Thr(GGU) m(6)t(6)A37 methyltransferase TsaA